jgi:pyridoxamine 5'-phosphate oxidase family protein
MGIFTEAEVAYLRSQRLARLATSSASGQPDVAAVTFALDGDSIVSGGFDITKTVRYGNLRGNPRAVIVVDDLVSTDPWTPRGIKVRGAAAIEEHRSGLRVRITPEVIWSWGLNENADSRFHGVERRDLSADAG